MAIQFANAADSLTAQLVVPFDRCTVSFWLRQQTFADAGVFEVADGPTHFDRNLYVRSDGRVGFRIWKNPGSRFLLSSVARTQGQWSHVLLRHGSELGGIRLVVDGDAVEDLQQTESYFTWQTEIVLGRGQFYTPAGSLSGSIAMQGELAEFAIWDAELTEGEEQALKLGMSPLWLTNRIDSLLSYRDFVADLNRPGIGPAFATSGQPGFVPHVPGISAVGFRPASYHFPRSPSPYQAVTSDTWAACSDEAGLVSTASDCGQMANLEGGV